MSHISVKAAGAWCPHYRQPIPPGFLRPLPCAFPNCHAGVDGDHLVLASPGNQTIEAKKYRRDVMHLQGHARIFVWLRADGPFTCQEKGHAALFFETKEQLAAHRAKWHPLVRL